jgi:outer membrane biosynthesis protein TonB
MRKLLTLAIPLLLGVGILTAALHPQREQSSSPRRQAGVATERALPAVIEEPSTSTATMAPTTSTTAAPAPVPVPLPVPVPSTTTSTAAKPMTTVTSKPPVTAKPKPAPTTTTAAPAPPAPDSTDAAAPSTIDCGQGTASARAIYGGNKDAASLYAEVQNESNREIELDRLVVQATYPNGETKTYTLDVAGKRVQPGDKLVLSIPESAPQGAPKEFVISDFGFHTAGLPECASH